MAPSTHIFAKSKTVPIQALVLIENPAPLNTSYQHTDAFTIDIISHGRFTSQRPLHQIYSAKNEASKVQLQRSGVYQRRKSTFLQIPCTCLSEHVTETKLLQAGSRLHFGNLMDPYISRHERWNDNQVQATFHSLDNDGTLKIDFTEYQYHCLSPFSIVGRRKRPSSPRRAKNKLWGV